MARIERFEDLEAWKLSRNLANLIYNASNIGDFPRDFALRDQIRRASISIVSNIAEGFERDGEKSLYSSYSWPGVRVVKSELDSIWPGTVLTSLKNSFRN